jgi:hypothetical protein
MSRATTSAIPFTDRPSERTPPIIAHAVWLYFRFPLSLRLVEELLLERGSLFPTRRSRHDGEYGQLTASIAQEKDRITETRLQTSVQQGCDRDARRSGENV